MHIARKFELLLHAYRRPDGHLWTGQEIDQATNGAVSRSYVTNLRKGRIENPGYDKLRAIALAIGFPPELWFRNDLDENVTTIESDRKLRGIGEKLSHLVDINKSEATGQPYTDAEVARLSAGDLTEEDVKSIRTGQQRDPSVNQIVALADVFNVHPIYFLDRAKDTTLLDNETINVLRDDTVNAIARKALSLPVREREIVLKLVEQLGNAGESGAED